MTIREEEEQKTAKQESCNICWKTPQEHLISTTTSRLLKDVNTFLQ